jgi:hypothetical protein
MILMFHERGDNDILFAQFSRCFRPSFDCVASRHILCTLLLRLGQLGLAQSDLLLLLNYCRRSSNVDLVLNLLSLVGQLLQLSVLSPDFVATDQCLALVHSLFRWQDPQIVERTVVLLCELHEKNLIKMFTQVQHSMILVRLIPGGAVTSRLYDLLLSQVRGELPSFFPLCCWMAMQLPSSERTDLLSGLEPSERFVAPGFSIILPIFLAFQSEKALRNSLILFLARCSKDHWQMIFTAIFWVGTTIGHDPGKLQRVLLREMIGSVDLTNPTGFRSFVKLAVLYLFFQEGRPLRSSLQKAFRTSPFPIDPSQLKPKLDISQLSLQQNWQFVPRKLFFALRINAQTREWDDISLVQEVFRLIQNSEIPGKFRLQLRIIAFLIPCIPPERRVPTLQSIVLPKVIPEDDQPFIDLVAYQCEQYQVPEIELSGRASVHGFAVLDVLGKNPRFVTEFGNNPGFVNEFNSFSSSFTQILESLQLTEEVMNLCVTSQTHHYNARLVSFWNSTKRWERLWSAMTIRSGPWENSAHARMKRDHTLCGLGVPMKLKRSRPTGDRETNHRVSANCHQISVRGIENISVEIKGNLLTLTSAHKSKSYRIEDVKRATSMKVAGLPTSVEIEFRDGKLILLKFFKSELRDSFAKVLSQFKPGKLPVLTAKWVSRSLSTFEYLLEVNRYSNRSFCCSSQYPIFPWLLMNMTSKDLDYEKPALYRPWDELFTDDVSLIDSTSSPRIVLEFLYGESRIESLLGFWESIEFKELSPEFFYFPEILFDSRSVLPKWARIGFDVVYQFRKALESEISSQSINQWIDLVFGCRQKSKGLSQVFGRPHPTRSRKPSAEPKHYQFQLDEKSVVFADVFNVTDKTFDISVVDSNGNCSYKIISFKESDWCETVSTSRLTVERSRIVGLKEKLFLMNSDTLLFDGSKCANFPASASISCDENWVIAPGRESNVLIYKSENLRTPFRTVFYYGEMAVCSCVSQRLHAFVIGTNQGGLLVYPLERGNSMIAVGYDGARIRKIWLTPGWGFIVVAEKRVAGGNMLSLFTINGTPLKTVRVNERIKVLCSWVGDNGFDYIAIATRMGVILVSEAYELTFQKPAWSWKAPGPVVTLTYNVKMNALVGVCVDGAVFCKSVEIS